MIVRLTCLLAIALQSGLCVAQEASPEASKPDKLAKACEKAKAERKHVFAVVVEEDCEECKRLEATLADPKVAAWMDMIAVVVRYDDSKDDGRAFTGKYRIHKFPSLLVFSTEGLEIDRRWGFIGVDGFRDRINTLLDEGNITESEPWVGVDVVLAAIDRANSHLVQGQHKPALEWYVWAMERRAARWPLFPRLHLPSIVDGMVQLAGRYEPAREALLQQLKNAEKRTLRGERFNAFSFTLIKLGYLALDMEHSIVEHYDRIAVSAPGSARQKAFVKFIYEPLLNAKRYRDLEWSVADGDDVIKFLDEARQLNRPASYIRKVLGARYEVLLGLGKFDVAAAMATTWLRYEKTWLTHHALAEAGLRTGIVHPLIEENARLAHQMSRGVDARTAIILARYQKRANPASRQPARTLETALKTVRTPRGRNAIREAYREITGRMLEDTGEKKDGKTKGDK